MVSHVDFKTGAHQNETLLVGLQAINEQSRPPLSSWGLYWDSEDGLGSVASFLIDKGCPIMKFCMRTRKKSV